jgi:hypothetical protein
MKASVKLAFLAVILSANASSGATCLQSMCAIPRKTTSGYICEGSSPTISSFSGIGICAALVLRSGSQITSSCSLVPEISILQ